MNFTHDAEGSRKAINQWVEDQTFNKIKGLIPAGLIDSLTQMVLVNAIYFKGDWTHPFKEKQTRSEPFYINREDMLNVRMMHLTKELHYHSDSALEAKILELPYGCGNLSMFILLPENVGGLEEMENKLTETILEGLIAKTRKRSICVSTKISN
jgi:serpin B